MQKVTITKVFRGKQSTKYGEKDKVAIKTVEHGEEKWISSFKTQGTENWKEGDVVEINVEERNGYLNFSLQDSPEAKVKRLEAEVAVLKNEIRLLRGEEEGI